MLPDWSFNGGDAEDQQSSKSEDVVHPPTSTSEESKDSPSASQKSTEEDDGNNLPEKTTLKKPDKILPCPRCNSMDTKFCYFNNYNVNQPRHFCKNCQRYWTAGGTMRNVPIGAGRRKTKNSISQLRHSPPLCESMASLFNIADKSLIIPYNHNDNNEFSNNTTELIPNYHSPVPCFPGASWPYPLHSIRWGSPVHLISPYWAISTHNSPSSGHCPDSPTLGKHSRDDNEIDSVLKIPGSKEEEAVSNCLDKGVLTPKTLRIDDPGEAAKSSIWVTLGMKNVDKDDHSVVVVGGGLFKAFRSRSKNHEKGQHELETSSVLRANPAALSRSVSFQESS